MTTETQHSGNKYIRKVVDRDGNVCYIDVYDVLLGFDVRDPALQHAIKKLLCTGLWGHKDSVTDKQESIDAIRRSIQLETVRKNTDE